MTQARRASLYWENILVLIFVPLIGIGGIFYAAFANFSWWTVGLAALWYVACTLANSAGNHRLFAHRTYRGSWPLRLFYLLFGAASFQESALRWSSFHRQHHADTDGEGDPHSVKRGFWWAHIGWLCYRPDPPDLENVKDLAADPLVRWQSRFYLPIGIAVGMALPMAIAWSWGDAIGGLLLAGFLRLAVQYQATFCINSVTHWFGSRPYAAGVSARDSLVAALLTMGEGYHNFHHRFPGDYRNGVRLHQYDPAKWWIWLLSKLGLASGLKRASRAAIESARAKAVLPTAP